MDELTHARGGHAPDEVPEWDPWWLIWSGPLAAADDGMAAANALIQQPWWYFNGRGTLRDVEDEGSVAAQLAWLIGHGLAYDTELVSQARASELAEKFVSLIPERRRWFSNYDGVLGSDNVIGSNPLTDFTIDYGFVAVADRRAWIAWFIDED